MDRLLLVDISRLSSPPSSPKSATSSNQLIYDKMFGIGVENDKASSSMEQEQEDSDKQNPLDIPELLTIVLGYVTSFDDLRTFRAVGKLWRDLSFDRWRASSALVLSDETIFILEMAYYEKNNFNYDDNLEPIFQMFEIPIQNFRFPQDQTFNNPSKSSYTDKLQFFPIPATQKQAQLIWKEYLSKAKYLDVGLCILTETDNNYFAGLKWILEMCPNLENLDIVPHTNSSSYGYTFPSLLQNSDPADTEPGFTAPNLQYLSIGKSYEKLTRKPPLLGHYYGYDFDKLLKAVPNLKHLWIQTGLSGNSRHSSLLEAAIRQGVQLESLCIVSLLKVEKVDMAQLERYLELVKQSPSPMKSLVLTTKWTDIFPLTPAPLEIPLINGVLDQIQNTVSKLELFIESNTRDYSMHNPRSSLDLSGGGVRDFLQLTHLKISLCYEIFTGKLISFDFRSLRYLRKLKDFRFETGLNSAEAWVKQKLDIVDLAGRRNDPKVEDFGGICLPQLKHFHFHGNFTSGAMKVVASWMENLTSLETILDSDNVLTVVDAWPKLTRVILLSGTDLPDNFQPLRVTFKSSVIIPNPVQTYSAVRPPPEETQQQSYTYEEWGRGLNRRVSDLHPRERLLSLFELHNRERIAREEERQRQVMRDVKFRKERLTYFCKKAHKIGL